MSDQERSVRTVGLGIASGKTVRKEAALKALMDAFTHIVDEPRPFVRFTCGRKEIQMELADDELQLGVRRVAEKV